MIPPLVWGEGDRGRTSQLGDEVPWGAGNWGDRRLCGVLRVRVLRARGRGRVRVRVLVRVYGCVCVFFGTRIRTAFVELSAAAQHAFNSS